MNESKHRTLVHSVLDAASLSSCRPGRRWRRGRVQKRLFPFRVCTDYVKCWKVFMYQRKTVEYRRWWTHFKLKNRRSIPYCVSNQQDAVYISIRKFPPSRSRADRFIERGDAQCMGSNNELLPRQMEKALLRIFFASLSLWQAPAVRCWSRHPIWRLNKSIDPFSCLRLEAQRVVFF